VDDRKNKYSQTSKGKEALQRARKKYDEKDPEKRKEQKREYMRRKRLKDPSYCKWKK
jgi:DNA-binding PadR family transcriptional regulator